jgi:hypothetical protein
MRGSIIGLAMTLVIVTASPLSGLDPKIARLTNHQPPTTNHQPLTTIKPDA